MTDFSFLALLLHGLLIFDVDFKQQISLVKVVWADLALVPSFNLLVVVFVFFYLRLTVLQD